MANRSTFRRERDLAGHQEIDCSNPSLSDKKASAPTFEQFHSYRLELLEKIPRNWVICSLSLNLEKEELYICRQSATHDSILARIPLGRHFTRDGEDNDLTYENIITEWRNLIDENTSTTKNEAEDERSNWWRKRKSLDKKIKEFLSKVENIWLGCFKGLLTFNPGSKFSKSQSFQKLKKCLNGLVRHTVSKSSLNQFEAMDFLSDNFYLMLLELNPETNSIIEYEDALYFLLDTFQSLGIHIDYDEMNMDTVFSK